jgi:hypothetical protein
MGLAGRAGAVTSPLGEDPIGRLTYDASGTMSAQLMRRARLPFRDEGSAFPNLVGTEQVRRCSLDGDLLSLVAETAWAA